VNIKYTKDLSEITEDMLSGGFFVDWPNPPDEATHLRLLRNSYRSIVAVDTGCSKVVGFINSVSDGVLTAYIPLLEVLPKYQNAGIGGELVRLLLDELKDLYMIDICHEEEHEPYYAKFGAYPGYSSIFRNYDAQSGKK